MSRRGVRCLSAVHALACLVGCGADGAPQRPELPALGGAALPAPGTSVAHAPDAGEDFPPRPVELMLPDDFAALPLATVAASDLLPYDAVATVAFSPALTAQRPTPAISGGTLAVGADGSVVASDPDRDLIYVIDAALSRVDLLELAPGEEPGRVVVAGARAFVALRAGGALLTLDLPQRRVSTRLDVCAAPRGVSVDSVEDRVLVACAGGDLVVVSPDGTRVVSRTHVAPDLRDVGRDAQGVWLSQYRSAHLLRLDGALRLATRQQPAGLERQTSFSGLPPRSFTPTLAWRTVAGPGGEPFMLHQRSQSSSVGSATTAGSATTTGLFANTGPVGLSGAYGAHQLHDSGFCESGIVHTTISRFGAQVDAQVALPQAVVPVDLSIAPGSQRAAAVAPGNFVRQDFSAGGPQQQLYLMELSQLARIPSSGGVLSSDCLDTSQSLHLQFAGEATAVQFLDDDTLLVQVRNPAELNVVQLEGGALPRLEKVIALSPLALRDSGHEVFHQNTGTGIACASCHGEALDDGHTWTFAGTGARRTQHLRGGVVQTAPFHWSGDLFDLDALINDVYQTRMGAPVLQPDARGALARWLDSLPAVPREPGDPARVTRGRALFESAEVGCASCHAGESLRSGGLFDVGTGGSFKVPSLRGVSLRLPLLHDGCADTLEKRFDPACGGANHGMTAQLSEEQLGDLIAYLASL